MKTTAKKSGKKTTQKKSKKKDALPVKMVRDFQKKLEEMREDLIRVVQKKREEVWPDQEVGDEADIAVRSLQRDLVFEQTGNEKRLLDEVEAALRRIEKGIFGMCEANGEKISMARLKAMPYARYCINCAARFESV